MAKWYGIKDVLTEGEAMLEWNKLPDFNYVEQARAFLKIADLSLIHTSDDGDRREEAERMLMQRAMTYALIGIAKSLGQIAERLGEIPLTGGDYE